MKMDSTWPSTPRLTHSSCGPGAIAAWKALLQQLPGHADPATLTAEAIADRRASAEGGAGCKHSLNAHATVEPSS